MMPRNAAIFMALAFELVGLVLGLVYVGKILDEKFTLGGLGIAGGAVLALIVWISHLVRMMKVIEDPNDKENQ